MLFFLKWHLLKCSNLPDSFGGSTSNRPMWMVGVEDAGSRKHLEDISSVFKIKIMTISFRTEEQWIFIVAVVMSSNLKWIMSQDGWRWSCFSFWLPWWFSSPFSCPPQPRFSSVHFLSYCALLKWTSLRVHWCIFLLSKSGFPVSSGLPLFGILLPRAFSSMWSLFI